MSSATSRPTVLQSTPFCFRFGSTKGSTPNNVRTWKTFYGFLESLQVLSLKKINRTLRIHHFLNQFLLLLNYTIPDTWLGAEGGKENER